MPLTGKDSEEIAQLENAMLLGVPEDGSNIGNKRLRDEILKWNDDIYLAIRKRLLDEGKLIVGRGKGGSVRRLAIEVDQGIEKDQPVLVRPPIVAENLGIYEDEASLYDSMMAVIRDRWVREQPFDQVLVERTDRGGRRADGIWARPDITVAAMTSYTYVPGRHFDIITFEIKHYFGLNVTAVYEALAHRRSATRAYVLVYIPDEMLVLMRRQL